jgi:predicted transcriptional regulator
MSEKKRIGFKTSADLVKRYEDIAREVGVSRNALMIMALKWYLDSQELSTRINVSSSNKITG